MPPDDREPLAEQVLPYTQLQQVQQKLKQFIPKYHRLVEIEERLRRENKQLCEDIERFNQTLSAREKELEQLQAYFADFLALVQGIKQEEYRSPTLHARALLRRRLRLSGAEPNFLGPGSGPPPAVVP
jgi:hypothetical protein